MPNNIFAKYLKISLLVLLCVFTSLQSFAKDEDKKHEEHGKEEGKSEKFRPSETILHHIKDSHEWHFFSIGESHFSIPLPVIIYSSEGIHFFLSSAFEHGHKEVKSGNNTYVLEHEKIKEKSGKTIYDLSITKNVASLFVSAFILLFIFLSVASAYTKNKGKAPKGIQSFFEPIIVFIRDDIARPNISHGYEKFMPYLLTVFFFIWFNNLLGLLPGGANLTGNIAITLFLAILSFFITQFNGKKAYWQHILWTPGIPLPLRIIILPIEIVGVFTKPFALMIRLFANITAGHIVILSLLCLIFIFKDIGGSGTAYAVAPVSVAFAVALNFLELFVAILQAYVFTLLSAMYFGSAVEEHHHEEHPKAAH